MSANLLQVEMYIVLLISPSDKIYLSRFRVEKSQKITLKRTNLMNVLGFNVRSEFVIFLLLENFQFVDEYNTCNRKKNYIHAYTLKYPFFHTFVHFEIILLYYYWQTVEMYTILLLLHVWNFAIEYTIYRRNENVG